MDKKLFLALVVSFSTVSLAASLCYEKGPYYSPDVLTLSYFSVLGSNDPPLLGDTLTLSFVVKNSGQSSVVFDQPGGIYTTVTEGKENPYPYQSAMSGGKLVVGQAYTYTATKTVDKTGTLKLWPSYKSVQTYAWQLCNLSAEQQQQDTTPPSVSVSASPSSPSDSQSITFTATASDQSGVSKVEIMVDGNNMKTCYTETCVYTGGPYPVGTLVYYAFAEDGESNSGFSATKTLTIIQEEQQGGDQAGPSLTLSISPKYPGSNEQVYYSAYASDESGVDEIRLYVDKEQVAVCGKSPCTYTGGPYSAGTVYVRATAEDKLGNTETKSKTLTVTGAAQKIGDTTKPNVTVKSSKYILPSAGKYLNISVDAEDDSGVDKIQIIIGGMVAKECLATTKCDYSNSSMAADLDYTVKVFDSFGNMEEESEGVTVLKDASFSWFAGDADNDTITNIDDNCVFVANENQSDCDNDGVGDECDLCPGTYTAVGVVNSLGCGCWDQDADEESPRYVKSSTMAQIPRDTSAFLSYAAATTPFHDVPPAMGTARMEYAGSIMDSVGSYDTSGMVYVERHFTEEEEGIDLITELRTEVRPFICETLEYTEFEDYCSEELLDPGQTEYYCDRSGNLANETLNCSHKCSDGECVCEDSDGGRDFFEKGRPECYGYAECPDKEENTDNCLDENVLDEYFPIVEDDACRFLVQHRPCDYGCVSGICVSEETENTRNMDAYTDKHVFITSDYDWKNVLRLVPVAVWDDERGRLHKYPLLVYHREIDGADDRLDFHSVAHFLQQYAPTNVTLFGDSTRNDVHSDIDDVLVLDNRATQERIQRDPQRYDGVGLEEEQIQVIDHTGSTFARDIEMQYWDEVNTIVVTNDDNYVSSLLGAVWAARLNAPLYFKSEAQSAVINQRFLGRHIYLIGNFEEHFIDSMREKGRVVHYNNQEAEENYIANTSTNKVVVVNVQDTRISQFRDVSSFKHRMMGNSMIAPYLAAAKHEFLLTIGHSAAPDNSDCSDSDDIEDMIEEIDDDIDDDLERLWPGDDKPRYMTLLAAPNAIPESYYTGCYEGWAQFRKSIDWKYGSIADSHGSIDSHVGRIYGMTLADTSAYIARSVFYDELYHDHYDFETKKGLSIGHSFSDCADKAKTIRDKMHAEYRSFCFTEGSRDHCVTNSSAPIHYYYDSTYVTFCDHGYWFAWSDTLAVGDIPKLDLPYVFGHACATSNFWQGLDDVFSARMIRKGAIAYHGAVGVSYGMNGERWAMEEFSSAHPPTLGEFTSDKIHSNSDFREYFHLMGDPTLTPIFEEVSWS